VDRFDNMRVFAKVVESGSFAGAAVRLSISRSMVSQHVKNLEERLRVRLLNRTTRKVNLTETGRAYYERCTRLLADLEETERAASDMHAAPRGDLRVNASPHFAYCIWRPPSPISPRDFRRSPQN
jgi:DNA-binding transcriptional LysR family regulator